jgi:hypothetical protein
MSIVESTKSKSHRRSYHLEGVAGAALIAAAVFAATPKPVHADVVYTQSGGTTTDPTTSAADWFIPANWANSTVTGTLAESQTGNPSVVNIQANNTSMPSIGVVFDPGNDPNTPGGKNANYTANLANIQGTFYIASIEGTAAMPNKLTIDSGTIVTGSTTVGRDTAGILALNGGTFITESGAIKVQGSNKTTLLGSGTFEYHGGYFESELGIQLGAGACTSGVGKTSSGVGYFVVYNDGPDGAILSQNGFQFAANTQSLGTVGIAEFHYDLNTGGIGGVRPIQTNWNDGNAETGQGVLHIQNNTNASSRLNLVLNAAPTIIATAPQNLGLFDETVVNGDGTYPKAFYSVDGTTVFTQGATISASFGGQAYSWTISYSGQINFTNTATSAYSPTGIQGTGGDDVVLIGLPVPEPSSLALLGGTGAMIMARRRTKKKENQASGA